VTILLTTQYLEEADRLAERISVIDGGRVVAEGTAAELKHRVAGRRLEIRLSDEAAYGEVRSYLAARAVAADPALRTLGVRLDGGAQAGAREVRTVLDEIDPDRTRVAEFEVRTASLDDVFLALTGKEPAHA
jgi:ABC-2 type transport system ATP-binding protein